jgi:four helix bundle protein
VILEPPMAIRDHRDLLVWQKAMELVVESYRLTAGFPKHEQFGLTSQLRRAAISIPSNIAEGHGRSATKAYLNHLSIACGSLKELETQLLIAHRLNYVAGDDIAPAVSLATEVGRMLAGLRRSLDDNHPPR